MLAVENIRVERLDLRHVEELQQLHERCYDFIELVYGGLAPDEAENLLMEGPEGMLPEDKFVFGFFDGDALVGALDLIRHFPERNEYIIGLLMLDPERRRAGLGTRIHDAVERWVRAEGGTALRLVVQEQNPDALRF